MLVGDAARVPDDAARSASPARGRAVAVVAIHGVGAQDAGASAHAIADLLLNLDADRERAAYGAFAETALRIRTRRVEACAAASPPRPPRFFDERSRLLRDRLEGGRADVPVDILNMQGQLDEFDGDGADDQYETIRLEGERLASGDEPARAVHVYEMYWSDLVRVGSDFLAMFGELYQILFHLPSLGAHAVDFGTLQRRERKLWRVYSETQALAARLLTVGVPVFNLLLIVAATSFLPSRLAHVADRQWLLGASVARWCSGGLAALAVFVVGGLLAFRHTARATRIATVSFGVAVAVGVVTSYAHPFPILFVEWLVLAGAAIAIPVRAYDRLRPGASLTALFGAAAIAVFVATDLVHSPIGGPRDVVIHGLRAVEAVFVGLMAIWLAYLPLQLAAAALGMVAWLAERDEAGRRAVGRIARTARLSLALPTALFLSFTIPAASAAFRGLEALLPNEPTTYQPTLLARFFDHAPVPIAAFADELVYLAGTDGLVVVVGVVAFSAIFAAVGLLPAVLAEIFPPRGGATVSKRYGRWMTSALGWMRLPAELLVVAAAFATLVGVARVVASDRSETVRKAITLLACIVSGSTVGLIALRGRLESLALGFRPALEAALDVDTYLRDHPRDDTPRANLRPLHFAAPLLAGVARSDDGRRVRIDHPRRAQPGDGHHGRSSPLPRALPRRVVRQRIEGARRRRDDDVRLAGVAAAAALRSAPPRPLRLGRRRARMRRDDHRRRAAQARRSRRHEMGERVPQRRLRGSRALALADGGRRVDVRRSRRVDRRARAHRGRREPRRNAPRVLHRRRRAHALLGRRGRPHRDRDRSRHRHLDAPLTRPLTRRRPRHSRRRSPRRSLRRSIRRARPRRRGASL